MGTRCHRRLAAAAYAATGLGLALVAACAPAQSHPTGATKPNATSPSLTNTSSASPAPSEPGFSQQPYFLTYTGKAPIQVLALGGSVVATLPLTPSDRVSILPSGPDVVACGANTCDVYSHSGNPIAQGVACACSALGGQPLVGPDGRHWVYVKQPDDPQATQPTLSSVYFGGGGKNDQFVVSNVEPAGFGLDLIGWGGPDTVWATQRTFFIGGGASVYPGTTGHGLFRISVSRHTITSVVSTGSNCYPTDVNQRGVVVVLCVHNYDLGGIGTIVAESASGELGSVAINPVRGGYGDAVLSLDERTVVVFSAGRSSTPRDTILSAPFPGGRLGYFGPPGFVPVAFLDDGSLIVQNEALPVSPPSATPYIWTMRVQPDGAATQLNIPKQAQLFFA